MVIKPSASDVNVPMSVSLLSLSSNCAFASGVVPFHCAFRSTIPGRLFVVVSTRTLESESIEPSSYRTVYSKSDSVVSPICVPLTVTSPLFAIGSIVPYAVTTPSESTVGLVSSTSRILYCSNGTATGSVWKYQYSVDWFCVSCRTVPGTSVRFSSVVPV